MVREVARVYYTLSPADQKRTAIFSNNWVSPSRGMLANEQCLQPSCSWCTTSTGIVNFSSGMGGHGKLFVVRQPDMSNIPILVATSGSISISAVD